MAYNLNPFIASQYNKVHVVSGYYGIDDYNFMKI